MGMSTPIPRDRPAPTEADATIQRTILRYVTAYLDGTELGEEEFDACCNPTEFSKFLSGKLFGLLRDDRDGDPV